MKLLVTGSRDWPYSQRDKVFSYLNRATFNATSVTLLHGCCPYGTDVPYKGVDGLAELHGRLLGWEIKHFPPDRSKGRSGFAIRNAQMVAQKPDKVLAFFLRDMMTSDVRDWSKRGLV